MTTLKLYHLLIQAISALNQIVVEMRDEKTGKEDAIGRAKRIVSELLATLDNG